jgi:putative tricarboxylic transport membrane protein
MDALAHLVDGLASVLTPTHLLLALLGCMLGMLVGVLPGFGPAAATSLLFPVTYTLGATSALIVMAAVLYGATYGGTITAVLLNVPGEASSVATTIDGYQMAKRGRAGVALSIAAIGGFVGCMVGLVGFVVAEPLTRFAVAFGPTEFFALTVFALCIAAGLVGRSLVKGLIAIAIGLLLAMVGRDTLTGIQRLTLGQPELLDGLHIIPVIMGLFGLAELLISVERRATMARPVGVERVWPSRRDLRDSAGPIARGSIIGFIGGLIPGSPGATTAFASYTAEKRLSKTPRRFGRGAVEGVAGPETANNALAVSSMIPLFTLGIPASATMAVMLGVFTVNGLIPGPMLFEDHPDVAWTIVASMIVGNVILLILNIPMVRLWVTVLRTPYPILYVVVLGFMIVGAYTLANSVFNVGVMLVFGLLGYGLRKLDIPLTVIALTLVLGDLMETSLRQALTLSSGDPSIFIESASAAVMLALAAFVLVVAPLLKAAWRWRAGARRRPPSGPPAPDTRADATADAQEADATTGMGEDSRAWR